MCQGGDVMNPDNILRACWRTNAGALNYFDWSMPQLDALLVVGSKTTNQAEFVKIYTEAANIVIEEACLFSLFDDSDAMIVRKGISNLVHDPMTEWTFRMGKLK